MTTHRLTICKTDLQGLWLPLVTPFRDGELDEPRCAGLSGTMPAARSTA